MHMLFIPVERTAGRNISKGRQGVRWLNMRVEGDMLSLRLEDAYVKHLWEKRDGAIDPREGKRMKSRSCQKM